MTGESFDQEATGEAVAFIRRHTRVKPAVGLITGSGLASLADAVADPRTLSYANIPHFPASTVMGHPGELVFGHLEGKPVVVMHGRAHFYEGYPMQQVTFPVRVIRALGTDTLIITNAAGGLNTSFQTGDLMLITDHLNLAGMAGHHPLRGPNDPSLGPRFPNMAHAYDPVLRELAHHAAQELGLSLHEGVYAFAAGPSFETAAEVRFLRLVGADAVGMSTVPEVTVARHSGMRVLGISHISNVIPADPVSAPLEQKPELHDDVLEAGARVVPRLTALIRGIVKAM